MKFFVRKELPTYGQRMGEVLSAEGKKQLWILQGFAHGFVRLSDAAEFLYKRTDSLSSKYERAILWSVPTLNIECRLNGLEPMLTSKNAAAVAFNIADLIK